MLYNCPCCHYKTFEQRPPGTYEICAICFWEDDPVQFDNPHIGGGANDVSLLTAQRNFRKFGAIDEGSVAFVRQPTEQEKRAREKGKC